MAGTHADAAEPAFHGPGVSPLPAPGLAGQGPEIWQSLLESLQSLLRDHPDLPDAHEDHPDWDRFESALFAFVDEIWQRQEEIPSLLAFLEDTKDPVLYRALLRGIQSGRHATLTDPDAADACLSLLEKAEPQPYLRWLAGDMLATHHGLRPGAGTVYDGERLVRALRLLDAEEDALVKSGIVMSLYVYQDRFPEITLKLTALATDPSIDLMVRDVAAGGFAFLSAMPPGNMAKFFQAVERMESPQARQEATQAFYDLLDHNEFKLTEDVRPFFEYLRRAGEADADAGVRAAAAARLAEFDETEAFVAVGRFLEKEPDPEARAAVTLATGSLVLPGSEMNLERIRLTRRMLENDPEPRVRQAAVLGLAGMYRFVTQAERALVVQALDAAAANDPSVTVRLFAQKERFGLAQQDASDDHPPR